MNANAAVAVSVLAAAAVAAGITFAMQPSDAATEAPLLAQLQASVRDLQAANQQLEQRLDEVTRRQPATASGQLVARSEAPVVSPEQVAAAVEAYLRQRGSRATEGALIAVDATATDFTVADDLASLLGTSYFEDTAAWKRAFEAGKMDEVVAALEERAKANPKDVQSQMDLANAYMAYLQMDSSKWQLSMKADEQFDKVLGIDETHWEARFTKAMSYTFWPEFLGKKQSAISNFETLIKQQEQQPVQDHFAQTYLFLGNMLSERDPERARQIWQQGMQRHPNNEDLRARLAN